MTEIRSHKNLPDLLAMLLAEIDGEVTYELEYPSSDCIHVEVSDGTSFDMLYNPETSEWHTTPG